MAPREEAWAKAYWQVKGRENEFEDRPAFIRELHRVMEANAAIQSKITQERYRKELKVRRESSVQDELQYLGASIHWSNTRAR